MIDTELDFATLQWRNGALHLFLNLHYFSEGWVVSDSGPGVPGRIGGVRRGPPEAGLGLALRVPELAARGC